MKCLLCSDEVPSLWPHAWLKHKLPDPHAVTPPPKARAEKQVFAPSANASQILRVLTDGKTAGEVGRHLNIERNRARDMLNGLFAKRLVDRELVGPNWVYRTAEEN